MDIPQLDTTNVFLGVIAGLAVIQMLALVIGAVWLRRSMERVSQAATRFESERLAPMLGDVQQVANQAQKLITELQSTASQAATFVNGIEQTTRRAVATVDAVHDKVDAVVSTGWNEVHALKSGVRRGMSALVRPLPGRR